MPETAVFAVNLVALVAGVSLGAYSIGCLIEAIRDM
jgi:hypothetical protein